MRTRRLPGQPIKYQGNRCEKHPALAGVRYSKNGQCVRCKQDYQDRWNEANPRYQQRKQETYRADRRKLKL